jgi:UDP-4-amino-4,6-dideoxy-N-acetyl-beta-L-altrosamine transaminase
MKEFIPYGKQNIDQDDIDAVAEALQSSLITQGPRVEEFEARVAEYCGVKYAVAFNSGTSALHAAMYAAGVKAGDEVISSPITFVATTNSALYLGAKPVFVDMDLANYCIDIDSIEQAITNRTRVIAPIDFAGYPVEMNRIMDIAKKHNLIVIEDAAHALGGRRKGIQVGREADMTMLSFHPVKHITTGEGGMIICNDAAYYRQLKLFRSHGIEREAALWQGNDGPWYYEMQELGYNFRITDIQCALGLSQLGKLPAFLEERQRIAGSYDSAFQGVERLSIPSRPVGGSFHAYHLYPLLLDPSLNRLEIFNYMRANNIGVQVHYIPVHLHPYYRRNFGYKMGDFPVAEDFYARELSLPIYPGLSEAEQEFIIETLLKALG